MAMYPFGIRSLKTPEKKIPGKYESCQKLPTCNIWALTTDIFLEITLVIFEMILV